MLSINVKASVNPGYVSSFALSEVYEAYTEEKHFIIRYSSLSVAVPIIGNLAIPYDSITELSINGVAVTDFSKEGIETVLEAANGSSTYTVTIPSGTGYVVTQSSPIMVSSGQSVSFTITPATGYSIVVKNGDDTLTPSGHVFTIASVTENINITVTPSVLTYTITVPTVANVTIDPSTNQTVEYGDDISFTITAAEGYVIDSVTLGGVSITGVDGVYTKTNITANATLAVTASQT
jgi:hypothetical protein